MNPADPTSVPFRIAALLDGPDAAVRAAGLHGVVSALAAAGSGMDADALLQQWLEEEFAAPPPGLLALLHEQLAQTRSELDDEGIAFQPGLPDEDAPLAEQAEALRAYCQGFLEAWGLSAAHTDAEAHEVLRGFALLAAGVDTPADADAEQERAALAELIEFLRVGVLLLYAGAAGPGGTPSPA